VRNGDATTDGDLTISDEPTAQLGPAAPHGGRLIDRRITGEEAERLAARAPSLILTPAEHADLRALTTGAYSPLAGFMGRADREACLHELRLTDGNLWPIPVCLGLSNGVRGLGDYVALRDEHGRLAGVLEVHEIFDRDLVEEAALVYGTTDPAHPGVARVLGAPAKAVAGPIWAPADPLDGLVGRYALTPAQTRRAFAARGWRTVVGFQTRNPVHRAHEYLLKCALEICDGLLLHPLVGPTKDGDVPAEVRLRAYEAGLSYFPPEQVVLAALVAPMRYAGPREAVLHALVRKNFGCTHFIIGRDHAGVGSYYGPYEAQQLVLSLPPAELGVTPLLFEDAFYCRACGWTATAKTCPHPPDRRLSLSGTEVRAMLAAGELPPAEFSRPEVAAVLRDAAGPGAATGPEDAGRQA
jgi:sulfate adenylyltransferase